MTFAQHQNILLKYKNHYSLYDLKMYYPKLFNKSFYGSNLKGFHHYPIRNLKPSKIYFSFAYDLSVNPLKIRNSIRFYKFIRWSMSPDFQLSGPKQKKFFVESTNKKFVSTFFQVADRAPEKAWCLKSLVLNMLETKKKPILWGQGWIKENNLCKGDFLNKKTPNYLSNFNKQIWRKNYRGFSLHNFGVRKAGFLKIRETNHLQFETVTCEFKNGFVMQNQLSVFTSVGPRFMKKTIRRWLVRNSLKGILLVNFPEQEKNFLVKNLAAENKIPLITQSASLLLKDSRNMDDLLGVDDPIQILFDRVKTCLPCICFINNLDRIGKQRYEQTALGEQNALHWLNYSISLLLNHNLVNQHRVETGHALINGNDSKMSNDLLKRNREKKTHALLAGAVTFNELDGFGLAISFKKQELTDTTLKRNLFSRNRLILPGKVISIRDNKKLVSTARFKNSDRSTPAQFFTPKLIHDYYRRLPSWLSTIKPVSYHKTNRPQVKPFKPYNNVYLYFFQKPRRWPVGFDRVYGENKTDTKMSNSELERQVVKKRPQNVLSMFDGLWINSLWLRNWLRVPSLRSVKNGLPFLKPTVGRVPVSTSMFSIPIKAKKTKAVAGRAYAYLSRQWPVKGQQPVKGQWPVSNKKVWPQHLVALGLPDIWVEKKPLVSEAVAYRLSKSGTDFRTFFSATVLDNYQAQSHFLRVDPHFLNETGIPNTNQSHKPPLRIKRKSTKRWPVEASNLLTNTIIENTNNNSFKITETDIIKRTALLKFLQILDGFHTPTKKKLIFPHRPLSYLNLERLKKFHRFRDRLFRPQFYQAGRKVDSVRRLNGIQPRPWKKKETFKTRLELENRESSNQIPSLRSVLSFMPNKALKWDTKSGIDNLYALSKTNFKSSFWIEQKQFKTTNPKTLAKKSFRQPKENTDYGILKTWGQLPKINGSQGGELWNKKTWPKSVMNHKEFWALKPELQTKGLFKWETRLKNQPFNKSFNLLCVWPSYIEDILGPSNSNDSASYILPEYFQLLGHSTKLKKQGITLIASTNNLTTLDAALLRPGRFNTVINFSHRPLPYLFTSINQSFNMLQHSTCLTQNNPCFYRLYIREKKQGGDLWVDFSNLFFKFSERFLSKKKNLLFFPNNITRLSFFSPFNLNTNCKKPFIALTSFNGLGSPISFKKRGPTDSNPFFSRSRFLLPFDLLKGKKQSLSTSVFEGTPELTCQFGGQLAGSRFQTQTRFWSGNRLFIYGLPRFSFRKWGPKLRINRKQTRNCDSNFAPLFTSFHLEHQNEKVITNNIYRQQSIHPIIFDRPDQFSPIKAFLDVSIFIQYKLWWSFNNEKSIWFGQNQKRQWPIDFKPSIDNVVLILPSIMAKIKRLTNFFMAILQIIRFRLCLFGVRSIEPQINSASGSHETKPGGLSGYGAETINPDSIGEAGVSKLKNPAIITNETRINQNNYSVDGLPVDPRFITIDHPLDFIKWKVKTEVLPEVVLISKVIGLKRPKKLNQNCSSLVIYDVPIGPRFTNEIGNPKTRMTSLTYRPPPHHNPPPPDRPPPCKNPSENIHTEHNHMFLRSIRSSLFCTGNFDGQACIEKHDSMVLIKTKPHKKKQLFEFLSLHKSDRPLPSIKNIVKLPNPTRSIDNFTRFIRSDHKTPKKAQPQIKPEQFSKSWKPFQATASKNADINHTSLTKYYQIYKLKKIKLKQQFFFNLHPFTHVMLKRWSEITKLNRLKQYLKILLVGDPNFTRQWPVGISIWPGHVPPNVNRMGTISYLPDSFGRKYSSAHGFTPSKTVGGNPTQSRNAGMFLDTYTMRLLIPRSMSLSKKGSLKTISTNSTFSTYPSCLFKKLSRNSNLNITCLQTYLRLGSTPSLSLSWNHKRSLNDLKSKSLSYNMYLPQIKNGLFDPHFLKRNGGPYQATALKKIPRKTWVNDTFYCFQKPCLESTCEIKDNIVPLKNNNQSFASDQDRLLLLTPVLAPHFLLGNRGILWKKPVSRRGLRVFCQSPAWKLSNNKRPRLKTGMFLFQGSAWIPFMKWGVPIKSINLGGEVKQPKCNSACYFISTPEKIKKYPSVNKLDNFMVRPPSRLIEMEDQKTSDQSFFQNYKMCRLDLSFFLLTFFTMFFEKIQAKTPGEVQSARHLLIRIFRKNTYAASSTVLPQISWQRNTNSAKPWDKTQHKKITLNTIKIFMPYKSLIVSHFLLSQSNTYGFSCKNFEILIYNKFKNLLVDF